MQDARALALVELMRTVALVVLAGCSAGIPETTARDGGHHDGKVASGDGAPLVPFTRYRGTLAATDTVPFGGSPYCNYAVQLTNVVVDVVMHGTGELTTMMVSDTMVETLPAPCGTVMPQPPSDQFFDQQGGPQAPAGGSYAPALVGRADNRPATQASPDVVATAASANLTWTRTDQGPPLQWQVVANAIPLTAQSCNAGETSCLGGAIEGSLFSCNPDGETYTARTLCAQGCADTVSCR